MEIIVQHFARIDYLYIISVELEWGSRESGLCGVGCSAADAGVGVADERYSLDDLLPGLGEPGMDAHVDCFR